MCDMAKITWGENNPVLSNNDAFELMHLSDSLSKRTLASLDCNQVEKSTSKAEPISCENRSLVMDLSGALSMLAQYSIMASLNLDRAGQRKHSI